ncbi:MAG: type II secretion system F family protein [Pseudomonadota bacterium]
METSLLFKFGAIGWVGGSLFWGLTQNGNSLYTWFGGKGSEQIAQMATKLDLMFIEVSEKNLIRFYYSYLFCLFLLGVFFLSPNLGAGFAFGLLFVWLGWTLPLRLINILFSRRIKKFVLQMVDGLSLMSNGLRSGLNVPQAISIVQNELPNPISQEFGLILSQNKLGITLEEAMSNLSKRMSHDDIEMFTTSVNILKETGGNLAETFDTIAYTIRERIKIESKIAAMVSQGVLQGVIVVLMPFALGAILYQIDPEKIRPMFTTVPGWIMLVLMMTLQFLGGWTIWKIVQIKV